MIDKSIMWHFIIAFFGFSTYFLRTKEKIVPWENKKMVKSHIVMFDK